jgi:5-methylcytosine-specific restriction endonuclease McrA
MRDAKKRTCTVCGKLLKLNSDNFHIDPRGYRGFHAKCKDCKSRDSRVHGKIKRGKGLLNKCEVCGWSESVCDRHHIKPISAGGRDCQSNLIVLCPNCHRKAHFGLITMTTLRRMVKKRSKGD